MRAINQSAAIDFARGLAAIAVAAGHLRNHMLPDFKVVEHAHLWFKVVAFFAGFGGQAVIIFFVLSGWLVGGSFISSAGRPAALAHYAVDRVTRLWTVLIPIMLLDAVIEISNPTGGMKAYLGPDIFVANLFGLQTVLVDGYGGNYPLWSLANETAYYAIFPMLVLGLSRSVDSSYRISAAMIGVLLVTGLLLLKSAIVIYFSIWLIGVAASRVRISGSWRWSLLAVFCAVAVVARVRRFDNIFAVDAVIALVFAALVCSIPQSKGEGEHSYFRAFARFLSSFCFTLYVIHVPLIFAMEYNITGFRKLADPRYLYGGVIYVAFLAAIVSVAYCVSLVTERRTGDVRRWVKAKLGLAAATR